MKLIQSINKIFLISERNIIINMGKNIFRQTWQNESIKFRDDVRFNWNTSSSLAEHAHTAWEMALNLRDNGQDIKLVFHAINRSTHVWVVDATWNILFENKATELFDEWSSATKDKKSKKRSNTQICPVNMLNTSWILWQKNEISNWERRYWELHFEKSNWTNWILWIAITAIRNVIFKWKKHDLLFLCECRDISEMKLTEMAMKAELDARNNQKWAILSAFHDIQAPLWAIVWFVQQLKEWVPNISENLNHILDTVRHLSDITKWILDHAKNSEWKTEINFSNFSLDNVLESIINTMQVSAQDKWITLDLKINWELPELTRWDETKIRRILINLIWNAIKFTQKWAVTLDVNYEKWKVIFNVSDTWIWIPEERLWDIFSAFTQTESWAQYWWTWLWLTTSKNFTELMWWNIRVKSEVWKWSTFTVELPLEEIVIEDIEIVKVSKNKEKLEPISEEQREKYRSEFKILFADDTAVARVALPWLLRKWGYTVEVTSNWKEALDRFAKWWIEFAILDGNMPNMKWWEVAKQIKKSNPDLPIYSYSWSSDNNTDWLLRSENTVLFDQAWVNWHFCKIIEPDVIKETLLAHLDQYIREEIRNK